MQNISARGALARGAVAPPAGKLLLALRRLRRSRRGCAELRADAPPRSAAPRAPAAAAAPELSEFGGRGAEAAGRGPSAERLRTPPHPGEGRVPGPAGRAGLAEDPGLGRAGAAAERRSWRRFTRQGLAKRTH